MDENLDLIKIDEDKEKKIEQIQVEINIWEYASPYDKLLKYIPHRPKWANSAQRMIIKVSLLSFELALVKCLKLISPLLSWIWLSRTLSRMMNLSQEFTHTSLILVFQCWFSHFSTSSNIQHQARWWPIHMLKNQNSKIILNMKST